MKSETLDVHKRSEPYGHHLLLDGYGADPIRLEDEVLLGRVLEELPQLMGMRRLSDPFIVSIPDSDISGLSGFIFIIESHVSIHTYSKRRFITADVYSCKIFDSELVAAYLEKTFGISLIEKKTVQRGLRFNEV